jgi:hypothetical protein
MSNTTNTILRDVVVVATHEERRNRAWSRIQSYDTRPSTVAAKEFLGLAANDNGDSDNANDDTLATKRNKTQTPCRMDWKTLPQRVEWLCGVLEGWVR